MTVFLPILTSVGTVKEASFGGGGTSDLYIPVTGAGIETDPKIITPKILRGTRSTNTTSVPGFQRNTGPLNWPLYPDAGNRLIVGAFGQDATAGNGVTGVATIASAGSPGSAGSSTSFAATGVTSITATGITGTFAANQVILISGSTDAAGPETVICSVFSTPTLTVSATTKIHSGTITVSTVGAKSAGSVAAAGTTITLAAGLGALFTTGDVVQVDLNSGTTTTSECHKISVATDTLTITDASPYQGWAYAHASAVQVFKVVAPYAHIIPESNTLSSYGLEVNLNGLDRQFLGSIVEKLGIKAGLTAVPDVTATITAQKVSIIGSPAVATFPTDQAYGPSNLTVTLGGSDTTCSVFDYELNNGAMSEDTFNGTNYANVIVGTERTATLSATVFAQAISGNGALDYFTPLTASPVPTTSLKAVWSTGTGASLTSLTLSVPSGVEIQAKLPIKGTDIAKYDLKYNALYSSAISGESQLLLSNGRWLPY